MLPSSLLFACISLIHNVYSAFFQPDHPIYSAKFVQFRMDHSRSRQGTDDYEEQQLASDDYHKWTYVSPEFPMEQVIYSISDILLTYCSLALNALVHLLDYKANKHLYRTSSYV